MKSNLIEIWNQVNEKTFIMECDGSVYDKARLNDLIERFVNILTGITDWENRMVYLDVKDRMTFIIAFLSCLKLNAKLVLIPSEIKLEDYYFFGGLFLTDNKEINDGLMIDQEMNIRIGSQFNLEQLEIGNENLSQIFLYTSGSTGKAKLIPKSAINLLTEVQELKTNFNVDQTAVFYSTPPMYHIYGLLFGFLLPLYVSCKLVLDYHFSPESIADFAAEKKITHFVSIPAYYKLFVKLGIIEQFKNCRFCFSSSAPLMPEDSEAFFQKGIKIIEIYGSTETGGISFRTSAENNQWHLFSYVNIIEEPDHYLHIDGEDDSMLELKIVSPAISVDYDKQIGFNTGDIVQIVKKNKFILLGRNTRFIKIKGKRIDLNYVLEKVKSYLNQFSNFVIDSDQLYAGCFQEKIYIISEKKFPLSIKNLKNELKHHLPSYGVPRIFFQMEIPKNNMGKINKKKIEEILKINYED